MTDPDSVRSKGVDQALVVWLRSQSLVGTIGPSERSSGGGGLERSAVHAVNGIVLRSSIRDGAAIVALAVIAPLALIGLLVWFGYRAWLRRARARALV